jgi:hypothetical protein
LKGQGEERENTMVNTPIVETILDAMEAWIKQRPRLNHLDYDSLRAYRAEVREIGNQRKRALRKLAEVRRSVNHDEALLLDAYSAYAGQYYPTQYRTAALVVLEEYERSLARKWVKENPRPPMRYANIADVKQANKAIGGSWFAPSTMQFFGTRIESKLMTRTISGRQVFVTSEQLNNDSPRLFTIREALPGGSIKTVGEFQQYPNLSDARAAVRQLS